MRIEEESLPAERDRERPTRRPSSISPSSRSARTSSTALLDPTKGCFEKLEGKQDILKPETLCPTEDDTAALEAKVDAFVADVREELDPGSVVDLNPCTAAKLKCVSKKNKCKLGVYAKGFKKGLPPDPAKLQKCEDKFDGGTDPTKGCFEKAEAKVPPTCVTLDDTAAHEAKVDAEVNDVLSELNPRSRRRRRPRRQPRHPTPTPTVTVTPTPTVDRDRDADRDGDPYADAHPDGDRDADTDGYVDSVADGHPDAHPDADGHRDAHADANCDIHAERLRQRHARRW